MLVELVFLMVILKIPIVYLCSVVYYAIKSEPEKEHGEPMPVRVRRAATPASAPARRSQPRLRPYAACCARSRR